MNMPEPADRLTTTPRRTSVSAVRPCPHCGAPATITLIGQAGSAPTRDDLHVLFYCPRRCHPADSTLLEIAQGISALE
jgi:hypothetical protein